MLHYLHHLRYLHYLHYLHHLHQGFTGQNAYLYIFTRRPHSKKWRPLLKKSGLHFFTSGPLFIIYHRKG